MYFLQSLPKNRSRRNMPNLFCDTSITLTRPDKGIARKEIYRPILLVNKIDKCKNPHKILANQIQQYIKRIITIIKWDFSRVCINKLQKKNHMISIDTEKAFENTPIPIHDKNSQQIENRGEFYIFYKEHLQKTYT